MLEPGAGSGNIIRALRRYDNITIDAVEIREEERETLAEIADDVLIGDYMSMELGKYDAIIGNPPFSNAMDFVTKSYQHLNPGGVIIFLLRTAFLESKERFPFWKDTPENWLDYTRSTSARVLPEKEQTPQATPGLSGNQGATRTQ